MAVNQKTISKAVINRLPRYYRYLKELERRNIDRISSFELGKALNVTASQIRQDFNNFGGFGQQGYGYNVCYLKKEIGRILGLEEHYSMIIVGMGNVGMALANYAGFQNNGYRLIGLFDNDPEKEGKTFGENTVSMVDELPGFLQTQKVHIAVIAVPRLQAPAIAKMLADNGVKAIMNFTQADLNRVLPPDVSVQTVYLVDTLMMLSYDLASRKIGTADPDAVENPPEKTGCLRRRAEAGANRQTFSRKSKRYVPAKRNGSEHGL